MASHRKLRELAFPFLQLVLLGFLRFVLEVLVGNDRTRLNQPSLLSTTDKAIALLAYGFHTSDKPRWHRIGRDLDFIFEVVGTADAGGNWEMLRDERPPLPPPNTGAQR